MNLLLTNPELIGTNLYLFLMATTLAILEIQIEGAHGWAKNLPTWRPHPQNPISKIWTKIMSGKEATGYHLSMFLLVLLIFHLPYVFGLTLTLEHWIKTISLYFMFVVLWDFLWFVLNPHWPLAKFKKEHIEIHKKWLWFAPVDYFAAITFSFLIILPVHFINPQYQLLSFWVLNFTLFVLQTLLVILFTLYILKIDKWQENTPN
ncbi:hypothetical protein HY386_02885 [Candidatus Daviesbacteria bacterium]|nr:hypothetical protein [Candidatus Daviesbacteria bacterium]